MQKLSVLLSKKIFNQEKNYALLSLFLSKMKNL